MKTSIIKNIIISLFFALVGNTQIIGKSLQSSRLIKKDNNLFLEVKPNTGHHFNLEAPTSVQKNGLKLSTTTLTPSLLTLPVTTLGKCDYVVQTYVCDDKKTFCSPQKLSVTCEDLRKWENQPDLNKKKSVDVSSDNQEGSPVTVEPKDSSQSKKDIFIVNDPKMALDLAKKTNKPLFIDFFGVWCPPCNVLDETVFHSPKFVQAAKNFILLKLDVDDKLSWDLKSKYAVRGYPTVILATPLGEEITRFVGAIPETTIVKIMNKANKHKNISLLQKMENYKTKPSPEDAWDIIEPMIATESYGSALSFVATAGKNQKLSLGQKEILLMIPLLANKDMTAAEMKLYLPLVKDLFENYPISDFYYSRMSLLEKATTLLKDDELKKWMHEKNVISIKATLAKPQLGLEAITKLDLLAALAESYENLEQIDNFKNTHAETVKEYDRLMSKHKQNPNTNRGYNLERMYSLYKSGEVQKARTEYEKMITVYPHEFAFHYNYASILKDLKDWDEALKSAQNALTYSYGDNQLRAIYLVSEIEFNKGLKKEPIERISKTIASTELPKDETVRTHRYVKRLADLKKKIEEGKSLN